LLENLQIGGSVSSFEHGALLRMLLKKTRSVCPECLKVIDAEVHEEKGQAVIRKICPEHGSFEDVFWSDSEMYKRAQRYAAVGGGVQNPRTKTEKGCPWDCGICPNHRSHTILGIIDVTNRCNLACPVCFAHAGVAGYVYEPSLSQIKEMLENLRKNLPVPTEALQLSGGEPTVRDDLPQIIRFAKEAGFDHIEVNTNGIRLAESADYCRQLLDAGMSTLYLQFDGVTPEPYLATRGRDLLQIKLKAIENMRKAGSDSVVLVPTVVRGVNDHQLGDIIKFAAQNADIIRCVNFQPVSMAGRIDRRKRQEMRITIPDCLKLIQEQTGGQIKTTDFYPVPTVVPLTRALGALKSRQYPDFTTHEHCGIGTFIFAEKGKLTPITRYADVDGFMSAMNKVCEEAAQGSKTKAKVRLFAATRHLRFNILKDLTGGLLKEGSYEALGKLMRKMILVSIMHFQDLWNFDLERVQRCCIMYAVPDGRIMPFCTLNSFHRPYVERKFAMSPEEWRRRNRSAEASGAKEAGSVR